MKYQAKNHRATVLVHFNAAELEELAALLDPERKFGPTSEERRRMGQYAARLLHAAERAKEAM